jgi:hypothetical protein
MVGFGGAMAGLPVWGAEKRHTKNREMSGALNLGGPPFDDGIQQST